MFTSSDDMTYQRGYVDAMQEVYYRLTEGEGRTEAYETALAWVKDALGKS